MISGVEEGVGVSLSKNFFSVFSGEKVFFVCLLLVWEALLKEGGGFLLEIRRNVGKEWAVTILGFLCIFSSKTILCIQFI